MLKIHCLNTRTSQDFPEGATLQEILAAFEFEQPYPIVSAKVNNVSQGLRFRVYNSRTVQFLDVRDPSGMRVVRVFGDGSSEALTASDYEAAYARHRAMGCVCQEDNGRFYFIEDPDGYWIEILRG